MGDPTSGVRTLLAPTLRDALAAERLPHPPVATVVVGLAQANGYRYGHHPHIAWFGVRYLAMWSSGVEREDRPGQRVLWATSSDGRTWTEPAVLVPCPEPPWFLTAGGWAVDRGRVFAYVNRSRRMEEKAEKGRLKWFPPLYVDVMDAGEDFAWSPPRTIDGDFTTNESPRRTSSGTWLQAGESARHNAAVLRSAPGPDADHQFRPFPLIPVPRKDDQPANWTPPLRPLGEPTWIERRDGTIACFLRDDHASKTLFLTESADDGLTWSMPRQTDIPDAKAKPAAIALSDGQFVLVSNAVPARDRMVLTILLSDDGHTFDRGAIVRDEPTASRLRGGRGGYGYPSVIERDGSLWVIHSVNKEDIAVSLIALAGLP